MDSKLPLYHWLVVLVPGSIFLAAAFFLLQSSGIIIPTYNFGDSETVRAFAFLAIALFVGELLQAFGGLIEPVLFWSWGGSASKKLMSNDKYKGEVKQLRAHFGEDLSNEQLFEKAMAYCNRHLLGRSDYFNTLYAYSRSLFTGTLAMLIFSISLLCVHTNVHMLWYVIILEILIGAVLWNRTKKRGTVFVKEVIVQSTLSITQK